MLIRIRVSFQLDSNRIKKVKMYIRMALARILMFPLDALYIVLMSELSLEIKSPVFLLSKNSRSQCMNFEKMSYRIFIATISDSLPFMYLLKNNVMQYRIIRIMNQIWIIMNSLSLLLLTFWDMSRMYSTCLGSRV
jgi:hypothetical protein